MIRLCIVNVVVVVVVVFVLTFEAAGQVTSRGATQTQTIKAEPSNCKCLLGLHQPCECVAYEL